MQSLRSGGIDRLHFEQLGKMKGNADNSLDALPGSNDMDYVFPSNRHDLTALDPRCIEKVYGFFAFRCQASWADWETGKGQHDPLRFFVRGIPWRNRSCPGFF